MNSLKLTGLTAAAGSTERTHAGCLVSINDGTSSLVFTSHDVTSTCAAVICIADMINYFIQIITTDKSVNLKLSC